MVDDHQNWFCKLKYTHLLHYEVINCNFRFNLCIYKWRFPPCKRERSILRNILSSSFPNLFLLLFEFYILLLYVINMSCFEDNFFIVKPKLLIQNRCCIFLFVFTQLYIVRSYKQIILFIHCRSYAQISFNIYHCQILCTTYYMVKSNVKIILIAKNYLEIILYFSHNKSSIKKKKIIVGISCIKIIISLRLKSKYM